MEILSIPVYAKKVGLSRQWVHRMAMANRKEALKGVEKIDLINVGHGRKTYIITFNPDYSNEST